MGNWISVYADERRLAAVPGSGDRAALAEVLAYHAGLNDDGDAATYVERLVDGQFECVESEEGGAFLYAFQKVCETFSPRKTTVEIYLDEEQFPAMWRFACEANDTPVCLPTSTYGSPAMAFWPHGDVKDFIASFKALDFAELSSSTGNSCGYQDEVREIIATLEFSDRLQRGVYVFVNE